MSEFADFLHGTGFNHLDPREGLMLLVGLLCCKPAVTDRRAVHKALITVKQSV